MTWAEVRTARYRWEQQGVLHMGEHPPLLTPQGPGVPRARRPRFPRVEDSRTSGVPSSFSDSLGIASPFAVSASRPGSHHFFPRFDTGSSTGLPALVALVFPSASFPARCSPSLRPVLSGSVSTSFPTPATQDFFHFPYARVSPQLLSRSPLPSPSLRPVLSGSSDFVAAPPSRPQTLRLSPRSPFGSRFHRPGFGARFLWPASRAEAPSHHSPGAARSTG